MGRVGIGEGGIGVGGVGIGEGGIWVGGVGIGEGGIGVGGVGVGGGGIGVGVEVAARGMVGVAARGGVGIERGGVWVGIERGRVVSACFLSSQIRRNRSNAFSGRTKIFLCFFLVLRTVVLVSSMITMSRNHRLPGPRSSKRTVCDGSTTFNGTMSGVLVSLSWPSRRMIVGVGGGTQEGFDGPCCFRRTGAKGRTWPRPGAHTTNTREYIRKIRRHGALRSRTTVVAHAFDAHQGEPTASIARGPKPMPRRRIAKNENIFESVL